MDKTYREYAVEHLKQGNLCKSYVDYIVGEMEKLEKIKQIVNEVQLYEDCYRAIYKIKEVLEQE